MIIAIVIGWIVGYVLIGVIVATLATAHSSADDWEAGMVAVVWPVAVVAFALAVFVAFARALVERWMP